MTNPLLFLAILTVLRGVASPTYAPGFNAIGLIIGLVAGGVEELGWTGFATPRLLNKHNALKAGAILGVLWACWHMLADFSGNIHAMGAGWPLSFPVY